MSEVSRSVYQKLSEENKRLLKDIYILTAEEFNMSEHRMLTIKKWRDKYKQEKEFNAALKQAAKEFIKEHPEFDITKIKQNDKKIRH